MMTDSKYPLHRTGQNDSGWTVFELFALRLLPSTLRNIAERAEIEGIEPTTRFTSSTWARRLKRLVKGGLAEELPQGTRSHGRPAYIIYTPTQAGDSVLSAARKALEWEPQR